MLVKKSLIKSSAREGAGASGGDPARCDFSNTQARLHRIQGQISAVERMLNQRKDCLSVLQQIVAARKALDQVAVLVLESEAQGCFKSNSTKNSVQDLQRIIAALFRTM